MKQEIFGIPIFHDQVDVTKFDCIPLAPLEPTWDSGGFDSRQGGKRGHHYY